MLELLARAGEWIAGLPRELFGARLDSGLGIAAVTYTAIVAICFVIGGLRSVRMYAKAVDLRFDKTKLDDYNRGLPEYATQRTINWVLARRQQVRSFCFTIPFGMIVMATLYYWVRYSFTQKSYVIIMVCWIVGYMLVRPWWIWTVLRIHRKLVKTGEATPKEAPLHDMRLHRAMQRYFEWGLQEDKRKRQTFIGALRGLNPIIGVFRLRWLRTRLIRPLVICTLNALLWIITLPIAAFYLTNQFDSRQQALQPAWAPYAPPPA